MTTDAQHDHPAETDLLGPLDPAAGIEVDSLPADHVWRRWLTRGLILVVLVVLAGWGVTTLSGKSADGQAGSMLTHRVQRGELLVTVTEEGTLASADNVTIKCEVAGGSTILSLVEDGSPVEENQLLAQLDTAQLEEQISQQKITYEKARASYVQAEKDFSVAKISVQEYLEGTYKKEVQDLESQATIAMEDLRNAENTLQYTQRMFRKGYATKLQLEAKEFAVKRATLDLESAQTAIHVLNAFTKPKMLEDLTSIRDSAEARMRSEKAAFELEEARLARLEEQLEKCTIRAPKAGMVVYANDMSWHRRSSEPEIAEGASVREQQEIFRLPDLSQMQVEVAVHESKVEQIQPGMRARIRVQDREFQGEVVSVANQPNPTHFFSANVKEYATIVKVDGQAAELKPGMTAEVEILVAHATDTLTVPVAAVVQQNGAFCCWVKKAGGGTERRPLKLGRSSKDYIEVQDGVAEGEEVILNPRAVVKAARQEQPEHEAVDVDKRFGNAKAERPRPTAPLQARPPSGPPAERPAGPPPTSAGPDPGSVSGGRTDPMKLDKNGDGKLSRDEVPSAMAEHFGKIDTNGDGFISRAEISATRARMQKAVGPGGP